MRERQTSPCFFRPIGCESCDASAPSLPTSCRGNVKVSSQHKRAQLILKGLRPKGATGGYALPKKDFNLPFQPEPSQYTPKNSSILTLRAARIRIAHKSTAFKHAAPARRQCSQQVQRWKYAHARPLYNLADGKLPSHVLLPDLEDDEISQETDYFGASSLASTSAATLPRPIMLQFRPSTKHSLVEAMEMLHPFTVCQNAKKLRNHAVNAKACYP